MSIVFYMFMIHGDMNRPELVQTNMNRLNAIWSVHIHMNHKNIENNAIMNATEITGNGIILQNLDRYMFKVR